MTAVPELSKLGQRALAYAGQGWFVFPLKPRAKEPLTARGFQDATTNAELVRSWWTQWPHANIGLWPGPSGLFVVDLDGPAGEATAQQLGLLSEPTLTCITGRADGGRHLYFHGPGFPVTNAKIGDGIDIRSHGGYVVIPPSIHPTGATYRWEGRFSEVRALPEAVIAKLRDGSGAPAPVELGAAVDEGGRNNFLTRVAGSLLVKHAIPQARELLWCVNRENCHPPLERKEVEAILMSVAQLEAKKTRVTGGGTTLAMVDDDAPIEAPPLDPVAFAQAQADRAIARQRQDLSQAPQWFTPGLRRLMGPMLPGELHVVGALMGNGKTTFMFSMLEHLVQERHPTLYLPLEVDVEDMRRRLAAWRAGLDWRDVARHEISEEGQALLERTIQEHAKATHMQFPDDKRVTLKRLTHWIQWGAKEIGADVVIIDHFHRMDFGDGSTANYRVQVTETVRALKDLAREHSVVIIATAQLVKDGANTLDRYYPPVLGRLKESAGIAEEADVVLMLSRCLKDTLDAATIRSIAQGQASERDYELPNQMRVTCRKHRLDDDARDHSRMLIVDRARLLDQVRIGEYH